MEKYPRIDRFPVKPPLPLTVNPPKVLIIKRLWKHSDCLTGHLVNHDESLVLKSMEPPWLNNKKGESCIPAGFYRCDPYSSPKFPENWQVMNVENRSLILLHSGYLVDDTDGCIMLGTKFGKYQERVTILQSREALNRLRSYIGKDINGKLNSFMLNIIDLY